MKLLVIIWSFELILEPEILDLSKFRFFISFIWTQSSIYLLYEVEHKVYKSTIYKIEIIHKTFIFCIIVTLTFSFSKCINRYMKMENLTNSQTPAHDVSGSNYLSWVLNAKMYRQAMSLKDMINEKNQSSLPDKVNAMIFLSHHLH